MPHPAGQPTRRVFLGFMLASLGAAGCQVSGTSRASRNAKLTIALQSTVDVLDPHEFRTNTAYTVTANVYRPLLAQTFVERNGLLIGTENVEGGAAEAWEISPDGKRAVFHLRSDAMFADGTPVTAEDYAYVFRRSLLGPGYITALLPFVGISKEDQIQVRDRHTFVLAPSVKSPLFERFMTFQVFGAVNSKAAKRHATSDDKWAAQWLADNVTPSGPYTVTELSRDRRVVLGPNTKYTGPMKPENDGIAIRAVTDPDQRALLVQSGDLDLVDGLPPRLNAKLENDERVAVHRIPSTRMTYMGMNNEIAPFDNKLVRQAISYAVPYQTILKDVMYGFATLLKGPVSPGMDTFAGDKYWDYETNLTKARELLRQSGVGPFRTQLVVQQSKPQDTEAAVFIQESLRHIGITVEVQQLTDSAYVDRLTAGRAPMFLHYWYSWGEDPFYQMLFLLQSESLVNYARYSNPTFDKLLDKGVFELDPQRRGAISEQAQQIAIEDAPWVFLYSDDYVVVTGTGVSGVNKPFDQHLRLNFLTKST